MGKLICPPCAIWFTGLSGSGKTTLAEKLSKDLILICGNIKLFDGDTIRSGLNKDLGFTIESRHENIRRIAEVNKLFLASGFFTINAFITPTEELRELAKSIIGENRFFDIYLNTPFQICKQRDPKGLYKKAESGYINDFTGITSPFEPCKNAQLTINTSIYSVEECIKMIKKSFMVSLKQISSLNALRCDLI